MLVAGIKSRPVYGGLNIDRHAKRHLFALEGEGALALLDQVKSAGPGFLTHADILYVAAGSRAEDHDKALAALGADSFWLAPTIPVLLNRLNVMLGQARMGLRIYLAGTEGFIGQAMQVALNHGVDHASVHTEHRGSAARRVQCVHCKGITDNVTTSPFSCSHCGLPLLVRDHYSRRIGAFQGVNIDAEEPGTAPPPEELFP
ncbi:dimethylamine monooxygenase subunit DmmA family protein [Aestuariivirga sp.]|uniref:dimethylamine monooxygenase subunit DmmA family protein n=1 Tax=Aestuariivirga sp. TaxID=2650926 RepID=UPI003BAC25CE